MPSSEPSILYTVFLLRIAYSTSYVKRIQSSFYPHSLSKWDKLDPSITSLSPLSNFKAKLLKLTRPSPKLAYSIYDPIGLAILAQLRVRFSKLNSRKFRHNFRETINPLCPSNDSIEVTVDCHSYVELRYELLASVGATVQLHGLSPPSSNPELVKLFY